jgi:hypothetical protein
VAEMPFFTLSLSGYERGATDEANTIARKTIFNTGNINDFICVFIKTKWDPLSCIAFHVDSSFNADKILYINRFTQTGNNMINWKLFKYHQE